MTTPEEVKELAQEVARCLSRVVHAQATAEKWPDSERTKAYLETAKSLWLDADAEYRAVSERYRSELSVA